MEDEEYRKLAEVEDRMWYFQTLHSLIGKELLQALGEGPSEVLDAGCGTGGLIRRMTPLHPPWHWTGIDLSPVACAFAKERTGVEIRSGSVTDLPFASGIFGAVVSSDVLYHVDDDKAALREIFRVLRPGGTVVLNVPAYRWLWSYHDVAVHSRRRYERAEILTKLKDAGFQGIRSSHWNSILFPLVAIRRKWLPAPRGGSDVELSSAPVEAALRTISATERAWIGKVGPLPFGLSIFAVAKKP